MRYLVLALLFAIIGAVVALQNATGVTVRFAIWSMDTSLVLVIFGSAMVGALITLLLSMPMQIRLRWRLEKANRRNTELEASLAESIEASEVVLIPEAENESAQVDNAAKEGSYHGPV